MVTKVGKKALQALEDCNLKLWAAGETDHQALCMEVKRMQRQSAEFRRKWWQWCEARHSEGAMCIVSAETFADGWRDPKNHTAEFLRSFFAALDPDLKEDRPVSDMRKLKLAGQSGTMGNRTGGSRSSRADVS